MKQHLIPLIIICVLSIIIVGYDEVKNTRSYKQTKVVRVK